jgi:hypothetical protein
MNVRINEVCKIKGNAFVKYVFSISACASSLFCYQRHNIAVVCCSYIVHSSMDSVSSTSFQLHGRFHRLLLGAVWYLLRLESLHLSLRIDRIQNILNPFSSCPSLLLPTHPFVIHPFRFTASIYCKCPCLSFSPNLHLFLYKIPLKYCLNLCILHSFEFRSGEAPCILKV